MSILYIYMSLRMTKPTILFSDQVRHKPIYTVTEAEGKLEILDLRRGIVLRIYALRLYNVYAE